MITVELTSNEAQAVLEAIRRAQLSDHDYHAPATARQAQQKLLIAIHQQQGNQT